MFLKYILYVHHHHSQKLSYCKAVSEEACKIDLVLAKATNDTTLGSSAISQSRCISFLRRHRLHSRIELLGAERAPSRCVCLFLFVSSASIGLIFVSSTYFVF